MDVQRKRVEISQQMRSLLISARRIAVENDAQALVVLAEVPFDFAAIRQYLRKVRLFVASDKPDVQKAAKEDEIDLVPLVHEPQTRQLQLSQALQQAGIGYVHMPGLGGLRRRRPDSPNTGWKNASFQGYADYMLTPEFERSLQEMLERAGGERVALMCAEAVPPLLDRGCPGGAGRHGRTHPRRLADPAAHATTLGPRAGSADHLPPARRRRQSGCFRSLTGRPRKHSAHRHRSPHGTAVRGGPGGLSM